MIPPEFIPQLLSRIDIAEVIGQHVELKKAGASLKGLCPFHGEKSPSFFVTPAKQLYHCFGCGAHGDAVRFLMEHQGLGFVDAVQELSRRAGVEVPSDTRTPEQREQAQAAKQRRLGLSELLAQAAGHYREQLKTHKQAIDYLKRRGLTGRIAAAFGLGYAPAGWRSLARCFAQYDNPDLESAGLVIQGTAEGESDKRYDRFRDRIMFPIRNVAGEVIGFGGRVLDGGEPKYLNSPETPVFVKGTELYGLFEGRTAMRQAGYALVVEGYMDVVALAQHGLRHAVATLGTACTPDQVAKLYRFTEQIVFSFDGDSAGRRAAGRALQSVLPHLTERRSARFLFLPPEHDPDSYVRDHGAPAFEALVEQAKPLSTHLLDVAGEGCRLDVPEGRAKLLAQAKPLWELLPEGLLKRQLLGEIARLARLPDDELAASWGNVRTAGRRSAEPRAEGDTPPPRRRPSSSNGPKRPARTPLTPEDQVLRLLLVNAAYWEQLSHALHERLLQRPSPHAQLLAWLDRTVTEHGTLHWAALRPMLMDNPDAMAALESTQRLDIEMLDEQAALDAPISDLMVFIDRLDRPDFSSHLGRPAVGQRD